MHMHYALASCTIRLRLRLGLRFPAIAREIINRQEFKKYRDSVMVAQASPKRLV